MAAILSQFRWVKIVFPRSLQIESILQEHITYIKNPNFIITVPTHVLAPNGARPSAGMEMLIATHFIHDMIDSAFSVLLHI